MRVLSKMLLAAAVVMVPAIASAGTIDTNPAYTASSLAANDDESTGQIGLGFNFNFFGTTYATTYVNNNGNVTFNSPMSTYTPFGLTSDVGTPILAPFFADVDTRGAGSNLTTYGQGTYNGHASFGVDWVGVGYFGQHTDKLNSFQLIIVDRSDIAAGDADVYFNYDQILWETGDASDGVNGFGGSCAHAGYSNGTGDAGTNHEITGSGTCGAFLDGGPDALIAATNDGTPGQFLFEVRNGQVVTPPTGAPEPLTLSLFATGLAGLGFARRKRA